MQVTKRDGRKVEFDESCIQKAIFKAAKADGLDDISANNLATRVTKKVTQELENECKAILDIEHVQDVVEEALSKHPSIAKKYILYRAEQAKLRNAGTYLMDIYKKLTYVSAEETDMKRENANVDGDTAMGTMLKYGSEGSKYFIDNYVLPKEASAAHQGGDIHIHDKDFYMLTETCCQIDLISLFKGGFFTGHGYLREPNSIESYAALACIAIQANQNEMHGGQSVPHFDYAMSEGVIKTFRKEYERAFAAFISICNHVSAEASDMYTKERMGAVGFQPRLGNMVEYGQELINAAAEDSRSTVSKAHAYAAEEATKHTERRTYQAMEAFVHNLNTMQSRAGSQVPFSSVNYGTDTSAEGRLVIKKLLEATQAGLGEGETSIFPVQIFKVKSSINYDPEDPNYDLFKLAMEVSALRLFPNFSFLDAPFNLQYYKKGNYNSEIGYMGCRTRVIGNVHDKNREITCGRGNLSFTTINLPRLGIEAQGSLDRFHDLLDDRIDLVFRQLLHRFKIQSAKKVRNYPFLMGQGVWLDSDKLGEDDFIGDVLKHGTLTVGFIGLAETLISLTGQHHGESEEAQKLGLEIIGHMRERCDEEAQKTKLNFSLIATPAEGLSGRFVELDKARFGEIPGVTDKEYYTNSFHVPVYSPLKAHQKIEIEAPYHALTNAGHITYVELDGDTCKNIDAFESVIRFMHDKGVGYGSVNHPLDRDPVCGYIGVIDGRCPRCGRSEGEAVSQAVLDELRKKH